MLFCGAFLGTKCNLVQIIPVLRQFDEAGILCTQAGIVLVLILYKQALEYVRLIMFKQALHCMGGI